MQSALLSLSILVAVLPALLVMEEDLGFGRVLQLVHARAWQLPPPTRQLALGSAIIVWAASLSPAPRRATLLAPSLRTAPGAARRRPRR